MKMLGEIAACAAMFVFLFIMMVGMVAIQPLPSPASEEVFNGQ